jgi:hypothetical protein
VTARALAALVVVCATSVVAGCGGSQRHSTAAVEARRASLIVAAHALIALEKSVSQEVAAASNAWPFVDHGLVAAPRRGDSHKPMPNPLSRVGRQTIANAASAAEQLPAMLAENSEALAGPAGEVATIYQSYSGLVDHGWQHVNSTVGSLASAPAAVRSFLRANVNTYIVAVYDAHFDISEIGETLGGAYRRLGGGAAFRNKLTESEVKELERFYSAARLRLSPHPWQSLLGG